MKIWQDLAGRWSQLVFGEHYWQVTPRVRMFRLLEEVLELAQAEEVTELEVLAIFKQVYSRPPGDPEQELGGVMTTLAAYAHTAERDMEEAWWREFKRVMDPAIMEKVRNRNLNGDKIGMSK